MGGKYRFEAEEYPVIQICSWIVDIIIVVILAVFTNQYIGSSIIVDSRSMEGTLMQGDIVLVNKAAYKLSHVERYDIILFRMADGTDTVSIKRVVGLPGETVCIRDGSIYIDGVKLDTEELFGTISVAGTATEEIALGADEYFVLGDWPEGSEDSRFEQIGNVRQEQIIGEIWFRISPVSDIGPVR